MAGGTRQAPAGDLTRGPVRKTMPHHRTEDAMTTAEEIKQAVLSLPEAEYAKIMDWLHELPEEAWEWQIE